MHHDSSPVKVECQECTSLWVGQRGTTHITKILNNTHQMTTTQEEEEEHQDRGHGLVANQDTQGPPTEVSRMEEADHLLHPQAQVEVAQVLPVDQGVNLGMADRALHRMEGSVATSKSYAW